MTDGRTMINTLAPLRNVSNFLTLTRRLKDRAPGLPGMGCFYGPSGFGKSTAAIYAANAQQACLVQCKSVWTQKKLCTEILVEMGIPEPQQPKVIADKVDKIAEMLAREDVPLIIDEADVLVQKKMVEVVRDIYESSLVPVILIGEELLPQKLRQWERLHGRILSFVAAEPCDEQDFGHLVNIRCPGLELDPDLTGRMFKASNGSARRMVENLEMAREIAALRGLDRVTLAEWGKRDFFTGATPDARRFVA